MDNFSSPQKTNRGVKPFRVVLKALILFISFNLILTAFPDLSDFIFRQFLPRLHKFPMDVVYYNSHSKNGFGVENVFDVHVLFNTHIISYEKKPSYQYRVVFIGDSTVRDGTIYPVVDQQGCGEKVLHGYDLGYYGTSATKDLLILQEAMRYSPDLIVWSVTSRTFLNEPNGFAVANSASLIKLINTYNLSLPAGTSLTNGRSIFNGGNEIRLQTRLAINYGILFPAFGSSREVIKMGFNGGAANNAENQETLLGSGDYVFSALTVAPKIAGDIPFVFINEPRPNSVVIQPDYLQYRQEILSLSREQHWNFLDLWNLIPDNGFLDTIHRNATGEHLFNKIVIQAILGVACDQK
jgi:hypothetical protein